MLLSGDMIECPRVLLKGVYKSDRFHYPRLRMLRLKRIIPPPEVLALVECYPGYCRPIPGSHHVSPGSQVVIFAGGGCVLSSVKPFFSLSLKFSVLNST